MGDLPTLTRAQRLVGGWSCVCAIIACIIIIAVGAPSYVYLGPDEQVLVTHPTGKYVKNGPWYGQLNPFYKQTWRQAELLDPTQYAVMEDLLTHARRTEEGPKLLFLGAWDRLVGKYNKIVLQKFQYVRLIDNKTGQERVERGPSTIVPRFTEYNNGIETAQFVNTGAAVVVRNRNTGAQSLVTSCSLPSGVWYPAPLEELIDVRDLIQVLPHEVVCVRNVDGTLNVFSGREMQGSNICGSGAGTGGVAFFLPPFSKILRMYWSNYAVAGAAPRTSDVTDLRRLQDLELMAGLVDGELPLEEPTIEEVLLEHDGKDHHKHKMDAGRRLTSTEQIYEWDDDKAERRLDSIYVDQVSDSPSATPKRAVTAIDMRSQRSWYSYQVRTNDNVRLALEGTIFWRIVDVGKMLKMTPDPEGDVWSKSRSTLNGAVGTVPLDTFMTTFNTIVLNAFDNSKNDVFWQDRGIEMISIELVNYAPVDNFTAATLQSIIRQTVTRINALQKQRSQNDVNKEKLDADILLEANRTTFIEREAWNSRIQAETLGAADGGRNAAAVNSFMGGTNATLSNATERLTMYRRLLLYNASNTDVEQLATGNANLYMSPKDMELRLQMPSKFEL